MPTCSACGSPLPEDGRQPSRRWCSHACRQAGYRARVNLRRELAFDLLLRQTRAVQAGNTAALTAIAHEAERLLPASDAAA